MKSIFIDLNRQGKCRVLRRFLLSFLSAAFMIITVLRVQGYTAEKTGAELVIYAAGGIKPALDEIIRAYKKRSSAVINTTYGSGGGVLTKILLAKRGDIFISPENRFMLSALHNDVVCSDTLRTLACLLPAIGVKKGNPKDIRNLEGLARKDIKIAVCRKESTLLGPYAYELFTKSKNREAIEANISVVASDPNNLLNILCLGAVDAVITWHIYGMLPGSPIDIIDLKPEQLPGICSMEAAVVKYSRSPEAASAFLAFMASKEAGAILKRFGYMTEQEAADRLMK